MTQISRKQYIKLMIGITACLAVGLRSNTAMPFMVGSLMDSLKLSEMASGLMGSIELFGVAFASFAASAYIHRVSRIRLAFFGAIIAMVAGAGATLPGSYLGIAVFRLIAGLGAGTVLAAGDASIATVEDTERLYAFTNLFLTLFTAIVLGIIPHPIAAMGYKGCYLLLAAAGLLSLPFIIWLPGKAPVKQDRLEVDIANSGTIGTLACLGGFAMMLSQIGLWSFQERLGIRASLETETIGMVLGAAMLCGVVGSILAVIISSRFGRLMPFTLSFISLAVVCLLVVLIRNQTAYIVLTCLATGIFFFSTAYAYGSLAYFDPLGRWVVRFEAMAMVGTAIAPFFCGAIIQVISWMAFGWAVFFFELLALGLMLPLIRRLDWVSGRVAAETITAS